MASRLSVAIIGAGWAGLTCALKLCAAGISPTIFDANKISGGRARRVEIAANTYCDNGQHLLLGAYGETLAQIQSAHNGRDTSHLFPRFPVHLRLAKTPGADADLDLQRKPVPLIDGVLLLAQARGLAWVDRISFLRFLAGIRFAPPPSPDLTVTAWCQPLTDRVRLRIVEPLCLAALNTVATRASALVFHAVLKAVFAGPGQFSDMLIPAVDLSQLFPEPACAEITRRGGEIRLGAAVTAVSFDEGQFRVQTRHSDARFDHLVLAVGVQHAPRLLRMLPSEIAPQVVADTLERIEFEPISTISEIAPQVHLSRETVRIVGIDDPMLQWQFNDLATGKRCWVVSGREAHGESSVRQITEIAAARLKIPAAQLRCVTEKRATYACTPAQNALLKTLPPTRAPLWLTGDYCYPMFPATLEAATRSGSATASAIISALNRI